MYTVLRFSHIMNRCNRQTHSCISLVHTVLSLLEWKCSSDDVLSNIILLRQVEEFSDLRGSFRSKSSGLSFVSESWNLLFT